MNNGKSWTNSCRITNYFVQYFGIPSTLHSFLPVWKQQVLLENWRQKCVSTERYSVTRTTEDYIDPKHEHHMSFALSQSSAYKIYKKIKKLISHSLLNLLSRIFLTSKTTRSSLTMHGDCCGCCQRVDWGCPTVGWLWLWSERLW